MLERQNPFGQDGIEIISQTLLLNPLPSPTFLFIIIYSLLFFQNCQGFNGNMCESMAHDQWGQPRKLLVGHLGFTIVAHRQEISCWILQFLSINLFFEVSPIRAITVVDCTSEIKCKTGCQLSPSPTKNVVYSQSYSWFHFGDCFLGL